MFLVQLTQASTFTYHWEIDETPSGQESVSLPEPIEVEIEGSGIKASLSDSAATKLASKYKIFLSPQWDSEKAYLLLKTLNDMPTAYNYFYQDNFRPSYWILSDTHITHDIQFGVEIRGIKFVFIASEAFSYANPLIAKIDGIRGRFFSKRLHRAIVQYITDHGKNWLTKDLLKIRYGVSVDIPDYVELTQTTTNEHAGRFDQFKPEELISIISMLEEYPSGMISTPGLKYLVRRLDGTLHPLYPDAAAVAWTSAGYIEFMESAFKGGITKYTQRLILHEKAHFLWHYLFDEQLKTDWIELGGWFQEGDKWFTTKQTEFVSGYAHAHNPDEDMAESISYYIVNPNKLRSRSPAKYEFIQNRVMHGTRYISKIREDLTFEVYNLYPDYIYPGKIVSVDITVEGEPEEDKLVTVEIETYTENELDYGNVIDVGCYNDNIGFSIFLSPIDESGNAIDKGYRFRGQTTVSKHLKSGYYVSHQITVGDDNHNDRHHSEKDYGWQLYIDNPLEDLHPPEYVPNSARLSLSDATTDKGEHYQIITATWQVKDDLGIDGNNAGNLNDSVLETYSRYGYAEVKKWENNIATLECNFNMPHYMPSGEYQLNYIYITDIASNTRMVWFSDRNEVQIDAYDRSYVWIDEEPAKITLETNTPDFQPATLDLNRITINATPTNPEFPDGETIVDISFYIKDNISGYDHSGLYLRDPNGAVYYSIHYGGADYPEKHNHLYFQGEPNVFRKYTETVVLPKGSIPGTWGLQEMFVVDKAGNRITHDFTEIVRFEIGEEPAAPSLIAVLPQTTQLLANYPNPFNPETWIPYQLAEKTDVTLRIYSVNGALIRTFALGHQPAGVYQNQSRAAYWDGRNEWGEPVASGVYFYTLKAGDFTATRKLLIRK
jgi:hypothetical protein